MGWIVIIHCLVFILFWLTNPGFHPAVNEFLTDATGQQLSFVTILIFFSLIIGLIYICLMILKKHYPKLGRGGIIFPLSVAYLLFFYGSFILLFLKNPVQVDRLVQIVQYFRIIVDTGILLGIAMGIRKLTSHQSSPWKKWILIFLPIFLGVIPIFWRPGAVLRGLLPERPLLIAHRGASFIAPENTIAAMEKAAHLGVYGVETDILISKDGIPFLMHDATLNRTTNVAEIYPKKVEEPAANFKWDELARLNAGQWFVDLDPFGTIAAGEISVQDIETFRQEKIPTLSDLLDVVKSNNLWLIYDLRKTDGNHEYAGTPLDRFLAEILASGAEARTWFLADYEEIQQIQAEFPQATLAAGIDYKEAPGPDELVSAGYALVNSEYGISDRMIQEYRNSGLWVNLWTVDEAWQYSRLWIQGVNSVTTNNILGLGGIREPLMVMTLPVFIGVWILVWIFSILVTCSGILFKKNGWNSNAPITRD
jgi:glycerophosphoryl diester phosphodiesterase